MELPVSASQVKIVCACSAGLAAVGEIIRLQITIIILLLGLGVGVLMGLLGIGGGIVLVPALVHVLHLDQHMAQGTSLFILLPPVGLGALLEYRRQGQVDFRAGVLCAVGMLLGGYAGSLIALPMPSKTLKELFGCFLMLSAILLWRKSRLDAENDRKDLKLNHG